MRITYFIAVCACLSSTVFSDKIQHLNRLKRARSQKESVFENAPAEKELNSTTEIHPDIFPTLRKSRSQGQIETFQKKVQFRPQPQYPRDRSRHLAKRLKIRSIAGSTYEVNDNEVNEFVPHSIPKAQDEGPIYIKPVFRVTTKKNVFDSIVDVMRQLLNPPKNELGPVAGPIQMPGSRRKIYLRLMEPVDSSHITVRFVTQVPVPVIDKESQKHGSIIPFIPFGDPATMLLNRYPAASNDATFSSSNRHHSVHLPRNASHVSSKGRGSKSTKPKSPSEDLKGTDKENVSSVKVEAASGAETNKNHLYQYQSEDDAMKQVTEILKNATENEQGSKDSLEPWYQLSTHRLPLRQIAPLYPFTAMEHVDSNSHENTYKVPSDVLISSSPHSSSYEQYNNINATSGFYGQSYTMPNTYSITNQKENEFSNVASSYPISYHNQNEFNNVPSSTSYVKQNDLFSTPTTYSNFYEKPAIVPPTSSSYATSHKVQNGVQTDTTSQNALRVIDPPTYLLDYRNANKILEHTTFQQQRYNLPNVNEIGLKNVAQNVELPIGQVTWGKVKREKSESGFQKSVEITSDDNHEKWQPFVPEEADWHKAYANLAKVANGDRHETIMRKQLNNRSRQISQNATASTIEIGKVNQRQSGKHRNSIATTRSSTLRCSTSVKGDKCERMKSTIASTPSPKGIISIVEQQTQSVANTESIAVTTSKSVVSNTLETLRLNNITKSSWIERPQPLVMTTENPAVNNTTERSPLLIKVINSTPASTTENPVKNDTTNESMMNNLTKKSVANNTTKRSSITGTLEAFISNNTSKRLQLPKRPVIMRKPIFILKRTELNSTTKRTVMSSTTRKPTTSSTTERTKTTGRWKFRGAISKTKSSTT